MKSATQSSGYGAVLNGGKVDFRVWAPSPDRLMLRLRQHGANERDIAMERDGEDFVATAEAAPGDRYSYAFSDGLAVPDPVSRFLPE